MIKPYADIRKALVDGIRNKPDKPMPMKNAAEVWIAVIDDIQKHGADADSEAAFHAAHRVFLRMARNEAFPAELSPDEIAKAFGLDPRHQ